MRIAYADPPYPGCAHLYKDQPDYRGEVDHRALAHRLEDEYDGFCLHTASTTLLDVLPHFYQTPRVMAWVKPFAAFKANVSIAYAWEPVLVKAARKPIVKPGMIYRDFVSEPITLKRGLVGVKPERVCTWLSRTWLPSSRCWSYERHRPESNWRARLCRPLPNHSATVPGDIYSRVLVAS